MTTSVETNAKSGGPRALHSSALARSRWRTAFLLSPPLLWFLVIYISSLVLMLVTSFWSVNSFTRNIDHQLTGRQLRADHFGRLRDHHRANDPVGRARHDHRRHRRLSVRVRDGARRHASYTTILLGAVLLPLWASYLAKVYAWISILEKGGALELDLLETRSARPQSRLHQRCDVDRVLLHLAAVHDRADLRSLERIPRRCSMPRRPGGVVW